MHDACVTVAKREREATWSTHKRAPQNAAAGAAHLGSGEALVPAGFGVLPRLQRIVVLLDARSRGVDVVDGMQQVGIHDAIRPMCPALTEVYVQSHHSHCFARVLTHPL